MGSQGGNQEGHPGFGRRLAFLQRHSDLVLALGVAGIVGMMILPLPTAALDVLITLNLTVAVTLLLVAIYVNDAVRIATFPTILLVTTLYRLGLNVSSTRLILLQADAGQVIDAFGQFVVSGNYVVGAVVFLILLIIQFVVIAKGSERVAEVAARFTLDALPGKQMAIDADLRSGLMDQAEARRRRRALQRESQFYGAMDGAMKFVKGDAIAGIVITIVNIAAGLAIGVLQQGMDAGEALRLYGLLTIGDGLVSQIPALVISTAAGLIVTRVASEEEESHLGEEISGQILAHPRALAIVGALLALLAIVPGLPTVPFVIFAALCVVTAVGLLKTQRDDPISPVTGEVKGAKISQEDVFAQPLSPITLEVGSALSPLIAATAGRGKDGSTLSVAVADLRRRIGHDLGIHIPPIRVRGDAPGLEEETYVISLDEIPEARGSLRLGHHLCPAPADELGTQEISAIPTEHPLIASPACWLSEASNAAARAQGYETLGVLEVLTAHLEQVLRRKAKYFVGVQQVQKLIDGLDTTDPALVRAVVPRVVGIPLMTDVLRRLVEEGVSIRNLRAVVEALLEWGDHEKDPVALTELVRSNLKRSITHKYTGGDPALSVYLLSPEIEDAVRNAVQRSSTGTYLALDPDLGRDIVESIHRAVAKPSSGRDAVILTQPDVRRFVRKLIELRIPHAAVLSYQELEPTIVVKPLTQISPSSL